MSEQTMHAMVVRAFQRLRATGLALGMGELLAAERILYERFVDPDNASAVQRALRLLWCKNETEQWHLEQIWQSLQAGQSEGEQDQPPPAKLSDPPPATMPPPDALPKPGESEGAAKGESAAPALSFVPFKPPTGRAIESSTLELQTYWPVSRRYMSYTWRYLRRPVYEGVSDELDVGNTVSRAALSGSFVEPVYQRRVVNRARLLLLLDHRGTMMPFHRYLRDMVETLQQSDLAPEQRAVYYFEKVPGSSLFLTPYLTKPVASAEILRSIDLATGVMIVSDAGVARGEKRNRTRVGGTFEFLLTLYALTRFVVWLNPMPYERWQGTSAAAIASSVPMFPMNENGFSAAIDILSGRRATPKTIAV